VPVPALTHLEATAIQVSLAGKPVLYLAAYLSPSHPLIGADPTANFGWELPIMLPGDLNAQHVDWNSRLSTGRVKLLRDYADQNSCLNFGMDSPTSNPCNPSATPDVLDIVTTKNLSFPVYRNSCSALSSATSLFSLTTRVAHPFTTHRIALTEPTSKLNWKI